MNRVILASGGSFQGIVANTLIVPSQAIVYADVRKEIEKTITSNYNPATPLILADGQTVPTMIKGVPNFPNAPEILEWFKTLPAISLEEGMGMWPILGRMAMEMIINGTGNSSETLNHLVVTKIFDPIFQKAQGVLPTVELLSCNSLSGGVSGGVGHVLLQETLSAINTRVKAAITSHVIRIGGVTYNGLGDNVWPNAGLRLCETLTHVLTPDRLDQELRMLTLVELPVVGRNKELRDQLTTQFMQALFSTKVQDDLSIGKPNISKRQHLGAVKTITVSFWNGISPRIASADNYVNETRHLINAIKPDANVCEEIRVDIAKQGSALDVQSIQRIVNDQRRAPTIEELEGNLVYPAVVFVITNQKDATRLTEHELNKPARTPDTVNEYQLKANKYAGLAQRLRAEHDKTNKEYVTATTKLNETLSKINMAIDKTDNTASANKAAQKQSWWSKTFGSGKEQKQEKQEQSKLFPLCVTEAEEYYRLKARVEVLEFGLRTIQGQLDLYQERLRRLEKNLQTIIGENDTRTSAYVDFKPFGEIFGQLLPLSEASQTETMAIVLDNSVKNVTPVGLAIITGLQPEETDPIAIINTLLNSTPTYIGPDWGGKKDTKNPILRFLVFPPMGDELAVEIKAAMTKLDNTCHFATSDCNAGGLNVVELKFYQPEWIIDIVTPLYWKGLKDAMENPHLFCLPDIDTTPMVAELKEIYEKEFHPTATNAEIVATTDTKIGAETKTTMDTNAEPEQKLIT